jgi:Tol biopolymer transport system component
MRLLSAALLLMTACAGPQTSAPPSDPADRAAISRGGPTEALTFPGEKHLRNVRQLTFGGENAEAYFSHDGEWLTFQSTREGGCDQQYVMRIDGSDARRVSPKETGRTTCGFFLPGDDEVLYAAVPGPACPPKPDMSRGYVWPLYPYDLVVVPREGGAPRLLAGAPGYDAEATVSKDGWIVFTSTRDGDLELYRMHADGTALTRLTHTEGYDGGAFFSADGKRLVWRASRPTTPEQLADYRHLLSQGLVRPTLPLELWVGDADGKNARQVTNLGVASFAPFFHPDGRRIVFSSNKADPRGRNFDLWLVNDDGSGLEQVTTNDTFDGFPMFSPDGKKLVFASNRNAKQPGETNIFIADWVE